MSFDEEPERDPHDRCRYEIQQLQAEVDRLQSIVDKLPKRNDGTLYESYAIGPNATGWCTWRYDECNPWRVSPCRRYPVEDEYLEWQIDDAENDCEVGGIYATKEAAEKAMEHPQQVLCETWVEAMIDPVNHPPHYTAHPSGIEVIQITEHLNFCLGNAVKYILRADHKGNPIEDLRKAVWYIEREIIRRENSGEA